MKFDPESLAMLKAITNAFMCCYGKDGNPIKWFFIFGTLEEYIADLALGRNYDIDVGVIAREVDAQSLINSIRSGGYYVSKMVRSDSSGNPLKISFKINKDWPDLDLYFWVEKKGYLYHTYDDKRVGSEKLPEYTFRGIKKSWFCPDPAVVEKLRRSGPEMDRILDAKGVWHYDIFGDHSGYEFRCPFSYGSCLDIWYPVWRFRKYYRGNSMSPWVFKAKSCKGLC